MIADHSPQLTCDHDLRVALCHTHKLVFTSAKVSALQLRSVLDSVDSLRVQMTCLHVQDLQHFHVEREL